VKKKILWVPIALSVAVAIFGFNPFTSHIVATETLEPGYTNFESGTKRLANGTYQVSALTRARC